MTTVVFVDHTGATYQVEAPLNKSLMKVALDNAVPGILGDCGGSCSCATCHGYVDQPWITQLPQRSETEVAMLEGVPDLRDNSRLCCQIRMTPELDGIVVHLPEEQV
ncbi:MAG: (2Fe-2S)-binding protein [Burkholderiales bacterium 66-5]|uniref:2Fe-2S iron-sulfur cluster-binding protein n=1 Tax=Comamonas badia TaxID=265291 RepID=UPI0004251DF4|nr:2Fe-2S iron-sulfur cluster-binding protein [Comamonas badia]OJU91385.1 MAG: (2Fe-2S)-binding protein [Burkholderiales bacterium 66-5]